jgi:hypothetical protein
MVSDEANHDSEPEASAVDLDESKLLVLKNRLFRKVAMDFEQGDARLTQDLLDLVRSEIQGPSK